MTVLPQVRRRSSVGALNGLTEVVVMTTVTLENEPSRQTERHNLVRHFFEMVLAILVGWQSWAWWRGSSARHSGIPGSWQITQGSARG